MKRITLKAARVNAGLSRKQLADKIHVSEGSVKNWETGKTPIKAITLADYCTATGFEMGDIILPTEYAK